MSAVTCSCLRSVINLGNSIIGVSILAMPYCFKKCGIFLSVLLIIASGLITRAACHLVLKSAIMARRRNFEFLAFHTFGSTGKLAVEIGIIGFLIGVCVAFFVVVGDLGPVLTAKFFMIENSTQLRAEVLIFLGVFVAFPLGLLRKVDSLTSLSAISIGFYVFLILTIVAEALPKLLDGEWWRHVSWWQPAGLLSSLPIFSMALSCQTQLFEFFDPLTDPSLKKMNTVINGAVQMCSAVYISVGVFGYIAFYDGPITGNILVRLTPSLTTEVIKLGFILSVVISFPLCLFPCRSSLHSLIFKQGVGHYDLQTSYMPDHRFRMLTCALVTATIGTAIMVPNIEFVLGLVGSTIGITICVILPALIFLNLTSKNTNERRMAQLVSFIGFFILVACTVSTLQENYKPEEISHIPKPKLDNVEKIVEELPVTVNNQIVGLPKKADVVGKEEKAVNADKGEEPAVVPVKPEKQIPNKEDQSKRQEPPIPQEVIKNEVPPDKPIKNADDLDPEALKKEDKEINNQKKREESEKVVDKGIDKQEELLQKLEAQHIEQKKILEEQKKLLQELKKHKESHDEQNVPQQPQQILNPSAETYKKPLENNPELKEKPEPVKGIVVPAQNLAIDAKPYIDPKNPVQQNVQEKPQQPVADSVLKEGAGNAQQNNGILSNAVEQAKDSEHRQVEDKDRKLLGDAFQEENVSKKPVIPQVGNNLMPNNQMDYKAEVIPNPISKPIHPGLPIGNPPNNAGASPRDTVVSPIVGRKKNLSSKIQPEKSNGLDSHISDIKKREVYRQIVGTPVQMAKDKETLNGVKDKSKLDLNNANADVLKNNGIKSEASSSSAVAKHEMRRLLSQNLSSDLPSDNT